MGGLWETVAFIFGALGAHDQQNSSFAVGHQLLFLLAPLWINAFVYMTLARMMHFYLPDQKVWRIKSTSMSKIFVWADVVTFLIQAGGGSIATPGADANTIKIGLDIYTAGVGIQEACIIAFVCLMVMFHRKAAALDSTEGYLRSSANELNPDGVDEFFTPKKGWLAQVYALYVVLALITVRTPRTPLSPARFSSKIPLLLIFFFFFGFLMSNKISSQLRIGYRIAEFASGLDPTTNPLPFNEAYAYGLDAAPIILALVVLTIFHPGRVLQGRNSDFTEFRLQKKAAKKAKKEAKRMEKAEKKAAKAGKQLRVDSIGSPYESA